MRKIKDPSLFQSIRKFLTEDMPVVRKKSANTVEAYRYTLNLFLTFLGEKHNKLLSAVTAKDFCQSNVLGFIRAVSPPHFEAPAVVFPNPG